MARNQEHLKHVKRQLEYKELLAEILCEYMEERLSPYRRGQVWLKSRMPKVIKDMYLSYHNLRIRYNVKQGGTH